MRPVNEDDSLVFSFLIGIQFQNKQYLQVLFETGKIKISIKIISKERVGFFE